MFCAHRENLPLLLAAAVDSLGAGAPATCRAPLPTSGFWVLHMSGGGLVAADTYDLSDALDRALDSATARRTRRRRHRKANQTASSATAAMST